MGISCDEVPASEMTACRNQTMFNRRRRNSPKLKHVTRYFTVHSMFISVEASQRHLINSDLEDEIDVKTGYLHRWNMFAVDFQLR